MDLQSGHPPPLAAQISHHKAGDPAEPVQHHGDPYTDGAVAHLYTDQVAEANAEDEHGSDGHDHSVTHVVACSEHIGQSERQRPEEAGTAVVDKDKYPGQLRGLCTQPVQSQDRVQDQEENDIQPNGRQVCHDEQLLGIEADLTFVTGAHTLTDDGDHGKIDGLSHEDAHAVQVVGYAVGSDLDRAEAGDDAHHEYASKLEDAVLHAAWNADVENLLHHTKIQAKRLFHEADIQCRIAQQDIEDDAAHGSGDQRGNCDTGSAHVESEDTYGISGDIDQVDQDRNFQRDLGIAHGTEQRRAGIIYREEGEGEGGDRQVDQCILHNVRFNAAKEQVQHWASEQDHDQADQHARKDYGIQQLFGGSPGIFLVSGTQALGSHHGAACSQRRHDIEHQDIDHIHQRDAGHGSLPHGGDHHGVSHAHRDG